MEGPVKKDRIVYLDGVRGIASVIVFFYHYFLSFYPGLFLLPVNFSHTDNHIETVIGRTPLAILYSGEFAVGVFFVLSGYVLSHKYFITKDQQYLASSVIKRYFRLSIPILASVIISYIILKVGFYSNIETARDYTWSYWFYQQWNVQPNIWEALKEGIYSAIFEGRTLSYNSVLWTMNVEFTGSLFVFITLALFGNLRKRWLLYALILSIFWRNYGPSFLIGLALCDYYTSKERKPIRTIFLLILCLCVIYFGSYQKIDGPSIWQPINFLSELNSEFPFLIASASLIIIVLNSQKLQHFLSHKWFGFLGKISFSLYLIHLLILGSLSCSLFKFFYIHAQLGYFGSFLCMTIISLSIAMFLSYLMYKYIDKKATRFAGYFYEKLFKPTAKEHLPRRPIP